MIVSTFTWFWVAFAVTVDSFNRNLQALWLSITQVKVCIFFKTRDACLSLGTASGALFPATVEFAWLNPFTNADIATDVEVSQSDSAWTLLALVVSLSTAFSSWLSQSSSGWNEARSKIVINVSVIVCILDASDKLYAIAEEVRIREFNFFNAVAWASTCWILSFNLSELVFLDLSKSFFDGRSAVSTCEQESYHW